LNDGFAASAQPAGNIASREDAPHDERDKRRDERRQMILHRAQGRGTLPESQIIVRVGAQISKFGLRAPEVKNRIEELRAPLDNLKASVAEAFELIGITVALEGCASSASAR
jgi:hypothetical protein